MKRILVPTDFSKVASNAMDTAFDIARKSGAAVTLLHVIEEASGGTSFNVEGQVSSTSMGDRLYMMKLIQKTKASMEKVVKDPKYSAVKVEGIMRIGNAFHGMQTIITEQKVDLVVMGTSGRTGLAGALIGSNAEKVIRHAKCPVLTIPKKATASDFKNIVYATNMSKDEEVFSRILRSTQSIYNSTLHIVRINTPGDFQPDITVKEYMGKFVKKLGLKNYTLNIYNDVTIDEGIRHFGEQIKADMLAMATHGRSGIAQVIAGSVAESVAAASNLPLLTFVVKR